MKQVKKSCVLISISYLIFIRKINYFPRVRIYDTKPYEKIKRVNRKFFRLDTERLERAPSSYKSRSFAVTVKSALCKLGVIVVRRCEEATEVETHHQQTAATTMGVAEDETPSSLTSHPNNPNQEGESA